MNKNQATTEQLPLEITLHFYEGSYQFHSLKTNEKYSSEIAKRLTDLYAYRKTTEVLWCREILPNGEENRYKLNISDMTVLWYMTIDAPRQAASIVNANPCIN